MEKEVYTAPLVEVRAVSELSVDELEMLIKASLQASICAIDKMVDAGFQDFSEYCKAQENAQRR